MQKKIIALAIAGLVSGGAFAQSNVTISGLIDNAVVSTTTSYAGGAASRTQRDVQAGRQGTSNITFTATESLGKGLKAMANYSIEYDTSMNAGTLGGTAGAASGTSYVALESDSMGTVALGTVNTAILGVQGMRSVFGTKNGGGYGTELGTAHTRNADTLAYTSPSFGGFSFSALHVFGATTDTTATTPVAQTPDQNEIGLKYGNGPLSVAYAHWKTGMGAAGASDEKQNNLGASYTFGKFKLVGGWGNQKSEGPAASTLDTSNWNIGADFAATPNINIMANYGKLDDKLITDNNRKILGVGLKYTMSKRTSAYIRYIDQKRDNALLTSTTGIKTTLFGLGHSF